MRLVTLIMMMASLARAAGVPAFFGEEPNLKDPVPLAEAATKPGLYKEVDILLEGTVAKVCKKKGCWLILKDGPADIRITFKDYGFFVPKNCQGRRVRAQGRLSVETLSVKDARHFLKDEGASKAEIAKIKEPVKTLAFVASGLKFLD